MMSKKGKQEAEKERSEDYLRPGNLPFLSAPKVNRQIWMSLGTSKKSTDKKLQDVQKQFLQSAVPIVSVIEEMNRARSEGTQIDLTRMIATLSDSVAFLGSANVNMVQTRRDLIKDELGPNLKGVCSMEIPFSGEHLFGDDLNAQVKELTNARKLSEEFRSPLPFYRRGRAFQSTSYAITKRGSGSFPRPISSIWSEGFSLSRSRFWRPLPVAERKRCKTAVKLLCGLHSNTVSEFRAGGIKNCIDYWKELTDDHVIHSMVEGVTIQFTELHIQSVIPKEIACSPDESSKITMEIDKYLRDGIIEKSKHSQGEYISHIFPRPKPNGEIRNHFKFVSFKSICRICTL